MNNLIAWLKECFNTNGRWNRQKFWLYPIGYTVFSFLALFIISPLIMLLTGDQEIIIIGLVVVMYSVMIYVGVLSYIKRLRDLDRNTWLALILIIPFIGLILLVYCGFWEGTEGDNKYGPNPLGKKSKKPIKEIDDSIEL